MSSVIHQEFRISKHLLQIHCRPSNSSLNANWGHLSSNESDNLFWRMAVLMSKSAFTKDIITNLKAKLNIGINDSLRI